MKTIINLLPVLLLALLFSACANNSEQYSGEAVPEEVFNDVLEGMASLESEGTDSLTSATAPNESQIEKRVEILKEQIGVDPLCKLGKEATIKQYKEAVESVEKNPSDLSPLDLFFDNANSPCWETWKKQTPSIKELDERLSLALPEVE
jgi:hypothetical protein